MVHLLGGKSLTSNNTNAADAARDFHVQIRGSLKRILLSAEVF